MEQPLTNKQLISNKELEWLRGYDGWDLIRDYWIDEGCHICIGKAEGTYYIFRTFCYDNIHAMLSCDFEGNKTKFFERLLDLLQENKGRTTFR